MVLDLFLGTSRLHKGDVPLGVRDQEVSVVGHRHAAHELDRPFRGSTLIQQGPDYAWKNKALPGHLRPDSPEVVVTVSPASFIPS